MDIEQKQAKNSVGRPINPIIYTNVIYNDTKYVVGKVKHLDSFVYFVIDDEDYSKIKEYSWHYISNSYISHTVPVDDKRRELYLHNLILNRLGFPGKGSKETVDHINRIGLDNRKENLRISTQSEQNINQSKRKRNITLPEDSEINVEEIPRHIWYVKANGHHGDRFAIEFKTENITWKTTSSKSVSLKDKLQQAKDKLNEYYQLYPYLNPENQEKTKQVAELTESYHAIITLAE